MNAKDARKFAIPSAPGVYLFMEGKKILYIGKATSLRERVRSYFADDIMHTRGKHILDMVTRANRIRFQKTDSALEAVILESALIKKYQPYYNTKEKDNKSYNYIVITNEDYPRVLLLRERSLITEQTGSPYLKAFGPFPQGANLLEALKIIRKIFPFRDTCAPGVGKPCFNRQIGLCPGVCMGEISRQEYRKQIKNIILFFEGKKSAILKNLMKKMMQHARREEFEEAQECKKQIFALTHIKDVSLIKEKIRITSQTAAQKRRTSFRIEAYDIAHISGVYTVGVMVVLEDGYPKKYAYRKFKIRTETASVNDIRHLEEILQRRFGHAEWPIPHLVVIDGGIAQKNATERVLRDVGRAIPVASVVKDERHKPKRILGEKDIALPYESKILFANAEAHRFAVSYHRSLRDKIRPQKRK